MENTSPSMAAQLNEEEDACMSYEEEDTCMSYDEHSSKYGSTAQHTKL
jgi:hypothetical protein